MRRTVICAAALLTAFSCFAGASDDVLKASGVKGGLVVVTGCDLSTGSGQAILESMIKATTAGPYLVQVLDTDSARVEQVRAAIRRTGKYGRISALLWNGRRLPYADNLVNLLVCDQSNKGAAAARAMAAKRVASEELARVLAPRGVLMMKAPLATRHPSLATHPSPAAKGWNAHKKAVPPEIDDWTHYLHSPNNNSVAKDTIVGPPRHYQWIGRPRFSRSHDHLASVSAVVSANGRIFSIIDEGSIAFAAAAPRWKLTAQDAFSGVRLWERDIARWEYHLRDFRSGPADIARRLVAVGDVVYVTLGYGQPVIALDAATGSKIRTYEGTKGTREILCDKGTLFLVLGEPHTSWDFQKAKETVTEKSYTPPFERYTPPAHAMRIACASVSTGQTKWVNKEAYVRELMPATLTLSEGRVFFHNLNELVCLDAENGKQLWKVERPIERRRLAWSSPTVVAYEGVVYAADRAAINKTGELLWLPSGGYHQYIKGDAGKGRLIAYDAASGKQLWDCPAYEGFNSAVDILIADGLLWTGQYAWGNDPGITEARDPKTGAVKRTRPSDMTVLGRTGHARCHRAKATSEYLIVGRRGIDMVNIKSGRLTANFWVRGVCAYGVMPANGLVYVPPHSCACSVNGMLKSGFMALASVQPSASSGQQSDAGSYPSERLTKGPAYSDDRQETTGNKGAVDSWPTYRGDAARSGSTKTLVPSTLKERWKTKIHGKLTPPVTAQGVLLVASEEQHTVHALHAKNGNRLWSYTTGGRIDSPPTIYAPTPPSAHSPGRALCIFGSRDGYVYCLRLSDGELSWKFRAAPMDRLITADGQIESAWPVPGNVLVADSTAYFVAGRNSFLDGGLYLHKLDARTGNVIRIEHIEAEETKKNSGSARGYLPDILVSDGEGIFMRGEYFTRDLEGRRRVGKPHLWSSVGFLDHNWWHRTYWQYGTIMGSGWGGWHKEAQKVPVGRLLVTDGVRIYGYGRTNYDNTGGHVGIDGRGSWGPVRNPWTAYQLYGRRLHNKKNGADWSVRISVLGQALLLTRDTLFIAGPEDPLRDVPHDPSQVDVLAAALESDGGGKLLAISPANGKIIADYELSSSPVFDGLIAAQGRLYLTTKSGEAVCME